MTVEYASDGEVEPAGICLAVDGCYQRLMAIQGEIPKCSDGETWEGAYVIEEVISYLKALHYELNEWCRVKWPDVQIIPGLFREVRKQIRDQLDASQVKIEGDPDADQIMNVLASTAIADMIGVPIDLKQAHDRFTAIMCDYGSRDRGPERDEGESEFVGGFADCPADLKPVVEVALKAYPDMLDWLVIKGGLNTRPPWSLAGLTPEILAAAIGTASNGRILPPLDKFMAPFAQQPQVEKSGPTAGKSDRTAKAQRPTGLRKVTSRRGPKQRTAARR